MMTRGEEGINETSCIADNTKVWTSGGADTLGIICGLLIPEASSAGSKYKDMFGQSATKLASV